MDTSLLLALLFGAPVSALALAVGYHARLYLLDRGGALARAELDIEGQDSGPLGPPIEVVLDLRRSIDELQDQLARQSDTLSNLLSESAQRMARRELSHAAPAAAQPQRQAAPAPAPAAPDPSLAGADLPRAVQRLTAEGLSDRAIARRLRIGLEEVRLLARLRPAPAS